MRLNSGPWCFVLAGLALAAAVPAPAAALTLEEAIARALAGHGSARAAGEAARAAEARVGRARSFLFPQARIVGDYTWLSAEASGDSGDGGNGTRESSEARAVVEQTILDAAALPLLQQARHTRTAARQDAVEARRALAFETADAFLAALNAEQVVRAAEKRLELAEGNLREFRVRFDAQLVGSNDVTRAELEAASAERERTRAAGAVRLARLDLGYLTASAVEDSLETPSELLADAARPAAGAGAPGPDGRPPEGAAGAPPVDVAAASIERRPEVLAARARVAALRASAREPLLRLVPRLDATGSAWSRGAGSLRNREEDWSVALGLTWPLLTGGAIAADRAERSALARAAELQLQDLERQVSVEVASARVALESEQASLARAEVAVEVARRNAVETAELYRQGLARALEVVDANVQLFEAEVERAGAQYALARALLELRAARGLDPLEREEER